MNHPAEGNIIVVLQHLISALQPFARSNRIHLYLQTGSKELLIRYHAQSLILEVNDLIFHLVQSISPGQSIVITAELEGEEPDLFLKLVAESTGVVQWRNLQSIIISNKFFTVRPDGNGAVNCQLKWRVHHYRHTIQNGAHLPHTPVYKGLPDFYAEMRKRLKSHFTNAENLVTLLSDHHPKDAAFLKKMNDIIFANLEKEGFNAAHLSKLMNISRAQLLRRLQSIVKQSPACYIKTIRLQKAKELLETTDMNVGEVAYKTGFQTQSHFTRVFHQQFGLKPSQCRWTEKQQTDKKLQQTG